MYRTLRRTLVAVTVSSLAVVLPAAPASATVHEIVAQWCADRGPLLPRGITGGSRADNLAQPLFANKVIESVTGYDGGVLISFDFNHPAIKLVSTGEIVSIGPGTYVTGFTLDPEFAAFDNCARLN